MANLKPIQVGNSGRIPSLINSSNSSYVLKRPASNVNIIGNTSRGPILNYAIVGETNNKTLTSKFRDNERRLYGSISPYTDYGFGPKQPFIVKKPGKGGIGLLDYQQRIDDVVRISKFSITGKGLLFYGKQFLLQRQASYNETNIYNPLSPIVSTTRGLSFGLFPNRPKRHIDTGGGFLAGLLSATGIRDNPDSPPKGTAVELDILSLPESQRMNVKGGIRAKTGATARQKALSKLGSTPQKGTKGGFLSNLGKSILSSFGFGKLPNQFEDVVKFNNGIYYRADQDFYWTMLGYHSNRISQNLKLYGILDENVSPQYKFKIKFGPKTDDYPEIIPYSDYVNRQDSSNSNIERKLNNPENVKISSPFNKNFSYTQGIVNEKSQVISNSEDINIGHVNKLKNQDIILKKSQVAMRYDQIGTRSESQVQKTEAIKSMTSVGQADLINTNGIIDADVTKLEPDQILFYFHDLVNDKYVQFRSILTAISDNETVEWDDFKYLGRPDTLYQYKGFSRTINFSFIVNISSIRELHPTWMRLNYLKSMSRPSKYIDEKFMVPPMIKINIGDIFSDLPCAISSINMSIPDDAPWEILPDGEAEGENYYIYSNDIVKIPNVKWGQYPTRVEISMTANVMSRSEMPRIGNSVFGADITSPKKFKLDFYQNENDVVNWKPRGWKK